MISEENTQFNAPRWSPDGQSVAVDRHTPGAEPELVIVTPASRAIRRVARSDTARIVTPAWRPDGRAIVAAADFDGGPFNLYEFPLDALDSTPRQLTSLPGGALWPDVSPDGATLVFAGYTADGFDVFTMRYPQAGPLLPGHVLVSDATGLADPQSAGTVANDAAATRRGRRCCQPPGLRRSIHRPTSYGSASRPAATTCSGGTRGRHR